MLKHLLISWEEVEPVLKENDVMLFLDYDGTLTPIVDHPSLARLPPPAKKVLKELTLHKTTKISVISGRSLVDLKRLVGLHHLIYVGNHGLEIEGPKIRYILPKAMEAKKLLGQVTQKLKKALEVFEGVFIENKVFTVSVHYRQVPDDKINQLGKVFSKVVKVYLDQSKLTLTRGKKVWELRPVTSWNKGAVALWLLARSLAQSSGTLIPIYIGDDQTDEDAFRAISCKGIGVKITGNPREPSMARYYLRSPEEVFEFLRELSGIKNQGKLSHVRVRAAQSP